MDIPLFSIVIPVYNVEQYLCRCIDSVIKQTFSDIEIILVDDGSTDNSPKICDQYANSDQRIKVLHQENGGLAAARHAGASIATGRYIVSLDSDDYLDVKCLSKIYDIIKRYSVDIIRFNMMRVSSSSCEKRASKMCPGYYDKNAIISKIFPFLIHGVNASYFSPSLCGKAIKRELFVKYTLDVRLNLGEDGACTIPCIYNAESIYIMEDYLYYYWYNESSITKSGKAFSWDVPRIIADHLKEHIDLELYDFQSQLDRKITHDLFTVAISQFNRNEMYLKIARDIKLHLNEPIYKNAIEHAHFKRSLKAIFMSFVLKFRWIFPIYIFFIMRKYARSHQ